MTQQASLLEMYRCDICNGSCVEIDPQTLHERSCRVCGGTGLLDYQPPPGSNPFEGIPNP